MPERAQNWPGDYGFSVGALLSGGIQTLLVSLVSASATGDLSNLGIYNVGAYGAKCDGTTDDSASINSAIVAASPNGCIFFPVGKTIYLGSNLVWSGFTGTVLSWGVTFTGPGASNLPNQGNGYVKLAQGVTLQWGTFTIPTDNSTKAVTFPISFSSSLYSLTLGVQDTGANALVPQFSGQSKTGFTATCGGGTASDIATINFLAVGQ